VFTTRAGEPLGHRHVQRDVRCVVLVLGHWVSILGGQLSERCRRPEVAAWHGRITKHASPDRFCTLSSAVGRVRPFGSRNRVAKAEVARDVPSGQLNRCRYVVVAPVAASSGTDCGGPVHSVSSTATGDYRASRRDQRRYEGPPSVACRQSPSGEFGASHEALRTGAQRQGSFLLTEAPRGEYGPRPEGPQSNRGAPTGVVCPSGPGPQRLCAPSPRRTGDRNHCEVMALSVAGPCVRRHRPPSRGTQLVLDTARHGTDHESRLNHG
jgi:hypothetical protein